MNWWDRLAFAFVLVLLAIMIMSIVMMTPPAHGRDVDGRYAQSPLKSWFDSLRSGKGPCCSDADGTVISDVDWKVLNGHYSVRIPDNDGKPVWIDVPEEAVITEPNRAGKTMVWPIRGYLGVSIRCFMPGAMT